MQNHTNCEVQMGNIGLKQGVQGMNSGLKLGLYGGVAVAGLMLAGAAVAGDLVVRSGQTEGPQYLSNSGDTLLIEQGGTVSTIFMNNSSQTAANNGSITTTVADADGISSNSPNAQISSSGSITTAGFGGNGIRSSGESANITNSGIITTAGDEGHGIRSGGESANITNSGIITTTVGASHGIRSSGESANITNSGVIITAGVGGHGIRSSGESANITNSGTIISQNENAIFMRSTDATLNLLAGSAIQGGIVFGDVDSATLNIGPGLNTALTLGGIPDTVNVNGMVYTDASNAVLQGNLLAVVDVTGFAATDEILTDMTRSITGSVEAHLAAQRSCHHDGRVAMGDMSVTPVADLPPLPMACGTGLWGTLFGGYSKLEGAPETSELEHGFGGVMVGYDMALSASTVGGVFAVFAKGEAATPNDNYSNDMTSGFGGAYVSHAAGSVFVDLSVTAGVMNNDQDRLVNNNLVAGGLETASADYDGIVFSPSMKVGFNQGLYGSTLTPSVRVRYAGLYLDNYTEKGSATNLAVGDRDVHVVEVRGELAFALATNEVESGFWHTQLKGGVDGIFNWSDDVDATLLGTDIRFAAGDEDSIVRGFGGVEAVFTSHGGTQFTSAFEVGYDSAETFSADARLGVNVPF